MKAIFLAKVGLPEDALKIMETEEPQIGPNEVLVKVKAFGINFADILARTGMYLDAPKLPFVPGYEVAGVVEKTGTACSRFQPGMRVAGLTNFGGYAEKAVVHEGVCQLIPEGMSFEEACAIPVNGVTAYLALKGLTSVRKGESVLVHAAAGGVGLLAVQIALDSGCRVFGTVSTREKARVLENIGVEPLVHTQCDVPSEIMRRTNGKGIDLVLDSLGGRSISEGMRMLAAGGRFVSIGIASHTPKTKRSLVTAGIGLLKVPILHPYLLLSDSKSFVGINIKRISEQRPELLSFALEEVFNMVREGKIKPYIDSIFQFHDCPMAHRRLHSRQSIGKIVVSLGGAML